MPWKTKFSYLKPVPTLLVKYLPYLQYHTNQGVLHGRNMTCYVLRGKVSSNALFFKCSKLQPWMTDFWLDRHPADPQDPRIYVGLHKVS